MDGVYPCDGFPFRADWGSVQVDSYLACLVESRSWECRDYKFQRASIRARDHAGRFVLHGTVCIGQAFCNVFTCLT